MIDQPPPLVYTVAQFCGMMQVSRDTFERLVKRGELPAFKIGSRTYIAKTDVEAWLRARIGTHSPAYRSHGGLRRRRAALSGRRNRQHLENKQNVRE